MKVYVDKELPDNCMTCLYRRQLGCAHADRLRDWPYYALYRGDNGCPSWWPAHKYREMMRG